LIYLLAMVPAIRLPDAVDELLEDGGEAEAGARAGAGAGAGAAGSNGRGEVNHSRSGANDWEPAGHGPNGFDAEGDRGTDGSRRGRGTDGGRGADGMPSRAGQNGHNGAGRAATGGKGFRWKLFPEPVGPVVIEALRANITLRAYSGFMIFFLAFLLRTEHFGSVSDKLALGEMIAAVAVGGFIGTAIGAALRSRAPQVMVYSMLAYAAVATTLCAAFFGLWAAIIVAFSAAVCQTLVKLALDSIVQHEVRPEVRSSTFAASETLHQLSWVVGGLLGLLLSLTSGVIGLAVAAAGLTLAFGSLLVARRNRILRGRTPAPAST